MILQRIPSKHALLLAAFFSASMLAAAFIAQYGFNLHPCDLCLMQRYPYAAIVGLGMVSAYAIASARAQRGMLWVIALLFLTDAGIAFYHAGVEVGWFPGPQSCSNASTGGETLEELRAQIMNAPLVSCDQAMTHILGLSLAAWNAIAAFLASILTFLYLRQCR